MKINRTYTYKRLLPVAGLGLGGIALAAIAAASASPANVPARLIMTSQSAGQSSAGANDTTPAANVTVNGAPVKLDAHGQAKVNTPSGGTVHVSTNKSASGAAPGSASTHQNLNYHIETSSGGTDVNSSTNTTSIQVFGNSSSTSSNSSSTIVTGDGQSNINVQSN